MQMSPSALCEEPQIRKAENGLINGMKFLASVMIFVMHINAFGDYPALRNIWEYLTRWAVPFFFMASSFFLFENGENANLNREKLIKYIRRIAILFAVWFVINFPSIFYIKLYTKGITNPRTWLTFLSETLLSSSFTGSWYLISCIFSAVVVFLFGKKFGTKVTVGISAVLYLLCISMSLYRGLLPDRLSQVLSSVGFPLNPFGGIVFFSLGKLLSENRERCKNVGTKTCLVVSGVCGLFYLGEILFAEHFSYYGSSDCAFCIIPCSFFLFLACLNCKRQFPEWRNLRKISTLIYCGQGNIMLAAPVITKLIGIQSSLLKGLIAILLLCAGVAFALFLQKKRVPLAKFLT